MVSISYHSLVITIHNNSFYEFTCLINTYNYNYYQREVMH